MIDQQLAPVPPPPEGPWPREDPRRRGRWRVPAVIALATGAPVAAWFILRAACVTVLVVAMLLATVTAGGRALVGPGAGASAADGSAPARQHRGVLPPGSGADPAESRPVPPVASRDAAGAAAFARYYVEVFVHGYRTGDLAPLKAAQTPACESCTVETGFIGAAQQSGAVLGDPGLGDPVVTVESVAGTSALVHISVDVAAAQPLLVDEDTVPVPAHRAERDLALDWTEDGWRVVGDGGDPWFILTQHRRGRA